MRELLFEGSLQVSSGQGEFSLRSENGRLAVFVPSWTALLRFVTNRSRKSVFALISRLPPVVISPVPVVVGTRQVALLTVSSGSATNKPSMSVRIKPTPIAFLRKR